MDMAMNSSMEPIFHRSDVDQVEPDLPLALEAILRGGLVRSGERLYLARPECTTPPPAHFDDFECERWVNKIHLDTETPASDPSWRAELLIQGLAAAKRLLPQAIALTEMPVQISINLQSAPDAIDPEIDFATGALFLNLVRSAPDDFAPQIEGFGQPVLILTAVTD